jgi:hypothetical protein
MVRASVMLGGPTDVCTRRCSRAAKHTGTMHPRRSKPFAHLSTGTIHADYPVMANRGAWLFFITHGFLLACSSSGTAPAADASSGGASTGGSSGAPSGGSSGSATGGSPASSGGHSGNSTGGSSGSHASGGSAGKDAMAEPIDAQADAPSGDASMTACSSCKHGQVCVEHLVEGGALFLADAGRCPAGRIPSESGPNTLCVSPPSFDCADLPAACTTAPGSTAVAHCSCARSLCGSATTCDDVSPTLMKCTLLAP